MKYLYVFVLSTVLLSAVEMSPTEHQSIHTYNKRPSLRNSGEKNMHKLHKINETEAKAIAEKTCKEKVLSLKLTHRNSLLYYVAKTKSCQVHINALDGSIIEQKLRNKK